MFSLLAFLYLQCFRPAFTAPLPNITALDTEVAPPWVDDPSGRGTWNLLYSCVFTLVLCVWTSIHLNVPPPYESAWLAWRRKMKWVVIALFAPEAVVFTAFQQWLTAICFLKELKRIAEVMPYKKSDVDAAPAEYSFDMIYAYYAVMGGFVVKIDHLHNTLDQATLTTNALLLLAQHGHFFSLSREMISDKSKANYLAKGLVCLQVLWVAGQAIERKLAGFPISLLEFHTLVHVFCALVMYMLWIQKPYDINEPTIVPTENFPNALAYIVASSRWVGSSGFQKEILRPPGSKLDVFSALFSPNQDPEFIFYGNLGTTPQVWFDEITSTDVPLEMNDDRIQNHMIRASYEENGPIPEGCTTTAHVTKAGSPLPSPPFFPGECIRRSYKPAYNNQGVITLSSGQALKSGLGPRISWTPDDAHGGVNHAQGISIRLSQKDINRLNMAGNFIRELIERRKSKSLFQASFLHPGFTDIDSATFQPFWGGIIRPYGDTMICARQSNWFNLDIFDILETFGKLSDLYSCALLAIAIIVIPAAYGGIHLSAIHNLFPSEIEFTLWKSSCIILLGAAGLPVLGILGFLALIAAFKGAFLIWDKCVPAAIKSRLSWIDRPLEEYWVGILYIYVAICLVGIIVSIALVSVVLLYVAARLFIVVESFISLRHVPIGVYRTPNTNFMSYIPHL